MLLSKANHARASAGQIKRYNQFRIELYVYILSWTYSLNVAAATLSTPSNQKKICIPAQIATIVSIFVTKDDLCMYMMPNIKYFIILSPLNISNLSTIKSNRTLAKKLFLYIDSHTENILLLSCFSYVWLTYFCVMIVYGIWMLLGSYFWSAIRLMKRSQKCLSIVFVKTILIHCSLLQVHDDLPISE